ncbi:MAG: hypothetical protein J6J09_04510 [Phocaeicola sp.]|nr:hypothetical protein [Phocaeicola sp.]
MANRPTNMNVLCPSGYYALRGNSYMSAIKEFNGYDEDMDDAEFLMDAYELTQSQVNQIVNNLKQWNDVIPIGYGTSENYVIPQDVVESIGDWGGNIFLSDVGDSFCDGLDYRVFILSTEDWGMI